MGSESVPPPVVIERGIRTNERNAFSEIMCVPRHTGRGEDTNYKKGLASLLRKEWLPLFDWRLFVFVPRSGLVFDERIPLLKEVVKGFVEKIKNFMFGFKMHVMQIIHLWCEGLPYPQIFV